MRHCANVADQFAQMLTQNPLMTASPGAVHAGNKRPGTEEEDIEGGSKKRRITRKTRDPDAPKRAASSYIFFQNDLRPELRKQHPDLSTTEILARVKKQWGEMTPEQKAVRVHPLNLGRSSILTLLFSPMSANKLRLNRDGKQRSGLMTSAGGLCLLRNRLIARRQLLKSQPNLPQWVTLSSVRIWDTKAFQGTKLAQKSSESSDSSDDTDSVKSEEEEDVDSGDEEEEEKEEQPAPSPPLSKSKAKRKAEVAATTTGKPKGRVSSAGVPISSRPEKKKRSKV